MIKTDISSCAKINVHNKNMEKKSADEWHSTDLHIAGRLFQDQWYVVGYFLSIKTFCVQQT